MDDAVDEIIETVLLKGGEVELMDDDELSNHRKIAQSCDIKYLLKNRRVGTAHHPPGKIPQF